MNFLKLFISAGRLWLRSDADQYAGALAYFVPFALVPLLLISIAIVGIVIGTEELMFLLRTWASVIDPELPSLLDAAINSLSAISREYSVPLAAILFFSFMIIVALNCITAGLHKLWGVESVGWQSFLRRYVRAVLFIFLLQAYLVFIILMGGTIDWLVWITGLEILQLLNPILFLVTTILLFAIGYGVLPLSAPSFHDRLVGSIVAGLLFFGIRAMVSVHFATSPSVSIFGTASLVIILLVWFYVGAGVILYGAAFTKVYSDYRRRFTI